MNHKQAEWRRELGEMIYAQRKKRGKTQVHMAYALGVSETVYRRAEEGRSDISRGSLAMILEKMGLDCRLAFQTDESDEP